MKTMTKNTTGWLVMAAARIEGKAMMAAARTRQALTLMAAAAVMGLATASCSSDDGLAEEPVQQPAENTDAVKKYTMTVTASKGGDNALARAMAEAGLTGGDAQTRALSYDSETKTLNATWKTGEKVKVIAADAKTLAITECGTLTATVNPDDATEATLTGTLTTAPAEGSGIILIYPSYPWDYTGQKGTLENIAANYDYAISIILSGDWSMENNHISVTGDAPVEFENKQAIVRFNLQDKAGNAISATSLTVHEASNKLVQTVESELSRTCGDLTITPEDASSVIWVALNGVDESTSVLTLTATTEDGDTYTYTTKLSFTGFTHGQFYSITVKMNRLVDLSKRSYIFEAQDGDVLMGELPVGYGVEIPNGATVTLRDASINGNGRPGITCNGDATIILEGSNTVTGSDGQPGIYVPESFTLTIKGSGSLRAEGSTYEYGGNKQGGAGIGGRPGGGNVIIEGGFITAIGGYGAPGIGGSYDSQYSFSFGTITIKNTVTSVTATKGTDAPYCIGPSKDGSCEMITFGDEDVYISPEWNYVIEYVLEPDGLVIVGGLKVTKTATNVAGDTWTLTPETNN